MNSCYLNLWHEKYTTKYQVLATINDTLEIYKPKTFIQIYILTYCGLILFRVEQLIMFFIDFKFLIMFDRQNKIKEDKNEQCFKNAF